MPSTAITLTKDELNESSDEDVDQKVPMITLHRINKDSKMS